MVGVYLQYRAENILTSTVGAVLCHLIKKFQFFKISEEQICVLSIALFIINKLPRILRNPPDIFLEIRLPELVGYNAFNLRLGGHSLAIGCSGYDNNDLGGDTFSKEIANINLIEFSGAVLVQEFEELSNWADAFIKANDKFQLTIESNITCYDETDLYNPDLEDEAEDDNDEMEN